MKAFIQKAPPFFELILVEGMAFGYFIYASLLWVGSYRGRVQFDFNDSEAVFIAVYEVMVFIIVYRVLRLRRWRLSDFGINFSWSLTGTGILLFLVNYSVFFVVFSLAETALGSAEIFGNVEFNTDVTFPYALLPIFINSFFEEFFVSAYIVKALRKNNDVFFVVGVSVLIRLLYHLYQGPIIATTILPMGILFAWAYYKWERLWPLVFAHSLWNVLAFS